MCLVSKGWDKEHQRTLKDAEGKKDQHVNQKLWGKKIKNFRRWGIYFCFFSGYSHSNPLSISKTPFLFILCPLPIPFSLLSVPPKLPYAVLVSLHIISHHIVSSFCSTAIASSQFPRLDPGAQHLAWECPGRGPSWTQSGERGVGRDSIHTFFSSVLLECKQPLGL